MADADDETGLAQPRDLVRRDGFGGDGGQQVRQRLARLDQRQQIGFVHRADQRGSWAPLRATLRCGPSRWRPRKPGTAARTASTPAAIVAAVLLAGVGNQRRQAGGGAELSEGGADGADGFDAGIEIEQGAAAAIDLQVDEARREDAAAHRHALRVGGRVGGDDGFDPAVGDDQRRAIPPGFAVENAGAGIGDAAHTVSVIFFRCGGWSGSKPRWRDSISTKP